MATLDHTLDAEGFAATDRRLAVIKQRFPALSLGQFTAVRLIVHVQKQVQDGANAILKPYGLNYSAYNVLLILYGTPTSCLAASELAKATGEKHANVTRLCDDLCEKGLIERKDSPDDRRRVVLSLTEAGTAKLETLLPDIQDTLSAIFRTMSDDDIDAGQTFLRRILQAY